ncbi:PREDICTED: uncharacterized protein LOC109212642 [Nicotiana attenuata]|uniref:uncharacterized protein LOC109212642 n=1 Tax=Nicotiana attenuata TaxID=49451 RepID=UPI0009047A8B|nr:PREDICTED: uncharacterized protein LOC109212642 [Nicotiana attenuata]
MERQVGQLANLSYERVPRILPPDTERNPKETINAVSFRSGHVLEDPMAKQNDELIERQVEIVEEQKMTIFNKVDDGLKKHRKGKTRAQKKKKDENKQRREKLDKQFGRFLEVLMQVHVNITFTEVLLLMPAYAKFPKEILYKKRKAEDTLVVKLTEHCSVIMQNKLPQKWRNKEFYYTLLFRKKLEGEIGEIKSIPVSLQLADQTTIIPKRIVEEENREFPLILGSPFFATSRAILDIQERQLMLRVGEERVIFKIEGAKGDLKEQLERFFFKGFA